MPRNRYTLEQVQWVRDNCRCLLYREAWQLFNARFGLEISFTQFKGILFNYKILLGSLSRRKSLPIGTVSNGRIKTGDNEWPTVYQYLGIKKLEEALKKKIKRIDKKLYTSRYRGGDKKYRIKNSKQIEYLLRGERIMTNIC